VKPRSGSIFGFSFFAFAYVLALCSSPAYAQVFPSHLNSAHGPSISGLALSLSAKSPVFQIGKPVPLVIELQNKGTATARVTFGVPLFAFSVVDHKTRKTVPTVPYMGGFIGSGPSRGRAIGAGQSWYFTIPLEERAKADHPGTYDVTVYGNKILYPGTVQSIPLCSNTITIKML